MQTLTNASYMCSRKSQPNTIDAFVLRDFVLALVDGLQGAASPSVPWESREEGIILIEEILLEGRACGFETREGFEELSRTILAFQIRIPFAKQVRQALTRAGATELQRVEGLRLCLVNTHRDSSLSELPRASRN